MVVSRQVSVESFDRKLLIKSKIAGKPAIRNGLGAELTRNGSKLKMNDYDVYLIFGQNQRKFVSSRL